jgi:hypothetical protein
VVNATPRPLYSTERGPVSTVQKAGWAPRPVRAGAENLAPTRIRSQDRAAHSQSASLLLLNISVQVLDQPARLQRLCPHWSSRWQFCKSSSPELYMHIVSSLYLLLSQSTPSQVTQMFIIFVCCIQILAAGVIFCLIILRFSFQGYLI